MVTKRLELPARTSAQRDRVPAARSIGQQLSVVSPSSANDIEAFFADLEEQQARGLILSADGVLREPTRSDCRPRGVGIRYTRSISPLNSLRLAA
jgi:hypothetical protein